MLRGRHRSDERVDLIRAADWKKVVAARLARHLHHVRLFLCQPTDTHIAPEVNLADPRVMLRPDPVGPVQGSDWRMLSPLSIGNVLLALDADDYVAYSDHGTGSGRSSRHMPSHLCAEAQLIFFLLCHRAQSIDLAPGGHLVFDCRTGDGRRGKLRFDHGALPPLSGAPWQREKGMGQAAAASESSRSSSRRTEVRCHAFPRSDLWPCAFNLCAI